MIFAVFFFDDKGNLRARLVASALDGLVYRVRVIGLVAHLNPSEQ
jgi:hypothetical protein